MPILNVTVSRKPDTELVKKIADGLAERTARILRKPEEIMSIAVHFVPPEHWIVGGRSLKEHELASFWLDIKVTDTKNGTVKDLATQGNRPDRPAGANAP